MSQAAWGIGAKLNAGLGVVLVLATVLFGVSYAALERTRLTAIQREHLSQMAALVATSLADSHDRRELQLATDRLCEQLADSTGSAHEILVEDAIGRVLVSRRSGAHAGGEETRTRVEREPAALRIELPLAPMHDLTSSAMGLPALLVVKQFTPWIDRAVQASIVRHLLFGALVVGLAMLAAGIMQHRLVVRPLRELVAASDEIASDGDWSPLSPSERRSDEIGSLQNHLASMSRRLVDAVRAERYGSAHLVAERVRREMDEPLRRATVHLAALEGLVEAGSESARERRRLSAEIGKMAAIVRRLSELPTDPAR